MLSAFSFRDGIEVKEQFVPQQPHSKTMSVPIRTSRDCRGPSGWSANSSNPLLKIGAQVPCGGWTWPLRRVIYMNVFSTPGGTCARGRSPPSKTDCMNAQGVEADRARAKSAKKPLSRTPTTHRPWSTAKATDLQFTPDNPSAEWVVRNAGLTLEVSRALGNRKMLSAFSFRDGIEVKEQFVH